jgi:SAM-dependent methyltransferase
MSNEERYSNYDSFAWFYEKHWSREVPNQIFTVIERLLLPRMPAGGHILDLCCGTGKTSAALTQRGFRVTGIEGSEEMLRYARRNASSVEFISADARSFRLEPVYDGILSTFDSLNHVMHLAELMQVFRNAHAALAEGGLFLFDMILEEVFLGRWQDYSTIVGSDNICVLSGQYDRDQRIGRSDVAMFRLKSKAWQRIDVVILERCYSKSEIKTALKKSGFKEVSLYYAEKDFGLADQAGRVFFLARKNSAASVERTEKRKKQFREAG